MRARQPGRAQALALVVLVSFAYFAGDLAAARARRAQIVGLLPTLEDPLARAYGLNAAGALLLALDAPTTQAARDAPATRAVRASLREALGLLEAAGPRGRWETLGTLVYLGLAAVRLGEVARAHAEFGRGLALAEERDNAWMATILLDGLGGLAWADGD